MDNVVGNVTSWFRRAVAGGSDEPNRSSSSTQSLHQVPPALASHHPAMQQQQREQQLREEEQRQLEEALRLSLQEQQHVPSHQPWVPSQQHQVPNHQHQVPSQQQHQVPNHHQQAPRHQQQGGWPPGRSSQPEQQGAGWGGNTGRGEAGGRGQAVQRGGEAEEEDRALQLALEISRREAEEAAQAVRGGQGAGRTPATVAAAAAAAAAQREAMNRHWSATAAARVGTGAGAGGAAGGAGSSRHVGMGGAGQGSAEPGGVGRGGGGGGEGAPDTSNDEEIARLLQQELSLEEGGLSHLPSAPPVGSNNSSSSSSGGVGSAGAGRAAGGGQQHPVWSALVPAVCAGCNGPLGFSPALSSMGGLWHPHCFTCHACKQTISEKQFNIKDGKPYHAACHRQLFHPKCTVCQDFIRPNPAGMINFRSHPFWGDKWCPAHMTDSTPSCTSCSRLQLGMPVRQQIPVLAVEQQALNDAQRAEREGHEHGSLTRGLCLSEEQTIQMVVRLPGSLTHASSFSAVGQQTMTVSRHCAVTAILVLYGLPRVLTASILAHELMHAWFKLDGGFRHLPPELEEGMCQVMAYLWLQTQAPPAPHAPSQAPSQQASSAAPLAHEAHSSFQQRFAAFCLHSIATDASPVYGDGFRAAHAAVLKHGLLPTLEHIRAYRALPRV